MKKIDFRIWYESKMESVYVYNFLSLYFLFYRIHGETVFSGKGKWHEQRPYWRRRRSGKRKLRCDERETKERKFHGSPPPPNDDVSFKRQSWKYISKVKLIAFHFKANDVSLNNQHKFWKWNLLFLNKIRDRTKSVHGILFFFCVALKILMAYVPRGLHTERGSWFPRRAKRFFV